MIQASSANDVNIKEKALLLMDSSSQIESIYVEVWADEDLIHEAAAEVKYSATLGTNSMDSRLGSTEDIHCTTCNLAHPRCPGHWGYIDLKDTFLRSSYIQKQLITMILSCICIHCHRPYFEFGKSTDYRLKNCFDFMKTTRKKNCSFCNNPIYAIIEDDSRNPAMNRFSEVEIGVSKTESMTMPLNVLRKLFAGLRPDDRKAIGIEGIDTEDFFFGKLPVMPNNVRPKRNFDGREENHQFTVLYEKIAKVADEMEAARFASRLKIQVDKEREAFYEFIYVSTIKELSEDPEHRPLLTAAELAMVETPNIVRDLGFEYQRLKSAVSATISQPNESSKYDTWKSKRRVLNLHVRELDNAFGKQTFQATGLGTERFAPILKKSEGVGTDMNSLIKSKHGLVREKIMGKRVNFCARTVASPAPFRGRSDEVWIPERFRNTLLMLESVTQDLKPTLKRMASKNMLVYVVLKNQKHKDIPFYGERTRWSEFLYYLRTNASSFSSDPVSYLEDGDDVERQLIEGINYVMLNRQPSIWRYSLGAFRVRFWNNATLGIPDTALKAFNGDFDGDEFNIWVIRDKSTEAEIIQLFSPSRNVLGNARNSTAYGLHYDPVTGIYLITRVVERSFPVPRETESYQRIVDFLASVENRYFEEQNEKLSSRRYFRVSLRKEGEKSVVVFSSEVVVPREYFIDEVKEHIVNMKGKNLTTFHQKLSKHGLFYVPESESNLKDLGRQYSGKAAFSLLLPEDFYFDNGKVKIDGGILVKGTVSKSEIGAFSHATIFHELTRLYGHAICSQVMDCLVWFTKTYLTRGNTISFGLEDYGFVGKDAERETDRIAWVKKLVNEYQNLYTTLKSLAEEYRPELTNQNIDLSVNNLLRDLRSLRATEEVKGYLAAYCQRPDESSARNLLLAASTLEEKNEAIYRETRAKVEDLERKKQIAIEKREFNKVDDIEGKIIDLLNGIRAQEAKNIESVVDPENAFMQCEGKRGNIYEVMGSVGLQTVSGKRIYTGSASNRALPSIFPGDTTPEALGMVLGNFTRGLDPSEAAFLSWAARIGPVVTKTQTSVIGDIANRMTNAFQGIVMNNGIPQEMIRENANIVQFSYGYDNFDPKYMLVRKVDQQYEPGVPASERTDMQPEKLSQTVVDIPTLQLRINDMVPNKSSVNFTPVKTGEEIELVNQFLKEHIVNEYEYQGVEVPVNVYVVKGVSYITTEYTVENVRNQIYQVFMSLKFPETEIRNTVINNVLKQVIFRLTGVDQESGKRIVETVHIGQGDKTGKYISGAIQQPIMQAALNTFHSSGQASSASSVKDRFIRLVTASASGKRSGTVVFNKQLETFQQAYAMRNQIREISLASLLKNPNPEILVDKPLAEFPAPAFEMMKIEYPDTYTTIKTKGSLSYVSMDYDPQVLRTVGLRSIDLIRYLEKLDITDTVLIVTPESSTSMIYLVNTDENLDVAGIREKFQSNIVARLSDHKINLVYRPSGEGLEDAYPTEFNVMEGIKAVYKKSNGDYHVFMNQRHVRKFGYKITRLVEAARMSGVETEARVDEERLMIVFKKPVESPIKKIKEKMRQEAGVVEAQWKESLNNNKPVEPENPGQVTKKMVGYYLKTIGGSLVYMMRHPLVNYRCSYNDGINEIVETLGLRAARNFMMHETEQIFSLSGSNEIDYRHVVLMIDSMVSQGTVSRLTFQGVDKIAGPNPLNQAGVGFAPATTFATAALKKREFRTDVGYAVNFMATKTAIVKDRFNDKAMEESQRDKIKNYMMEITKSTRTRERPTPTTNSVSINRSIQERTVIESLTAQIRDVRVSEPSAPVCRTRTMTMHSRAFDSNLEDFYGGYERGLDVFGIPIEI